MKLDIYENFITVADCHSITAAAKVLHIAQPALSAQIRTLESNYEMAFFLREPRSVELTDAGRIFYRHCKKILSVEQATQVSLLNCRSGNSGTLRIGTTRSNPDPVVSKLLQTYSDSWPMIHYEIYENNSSELISQTENGQIDLSIVRTVYPLPPTINKVLSLQEQFYVLVAENSSFLPQDIDIISLEQLKGVPLSISHGFHRYIRDVCQSYGFAPSIFSMNTSRTAVLQWAQWGHAAALLPMSERIFSVPKHMRCYKLLNTPLTSTRSFITRHQKKLSLPVTHMVETINSLLT